MFIISCTQANKQQEEQIMIEHIHDSTHEHNDLNETKEEKPDTRAFQKIPSQNHQVEIKDFAFNSNNIEINVGDIITWTQKDNVQHTVTIVNGPESFDSGLLTKGQSFTYKFTKPGVYEYKCNPHDYMRGKIIVK